MKKILTVITLATVGFLAIQGSAWAKRATCSTDSDCSALICKGSVKATCVVNPHGAGHCKCKKSSTTSSS